MPIYEYRCEACGGSEEKLETMNAPLEHDCASCGAPLGMKRQVSAPSFTFSGSGWYSSDYAGKSSVSEKAPTPPSGGCCGGTCACSGH